MPGKILCYALFAAIVLAGGWLRLAGLGISPDDPSKGGRYRPMHLDEAVQAVKFQQLRDGQYQYDPGDYHGPGLIASALPVAALRGQKTLAELDAFTLRLVPALYGLGCLLLLWFARQALGVVGWLAASAMIAVSAAAVFYSRYFIMEVPMVFFVTLAMIALWRYGQQPSFWPAILFGMAGGLTHATKETGAISFLAIGVAGLAVGWPHRAKGRWSHALAAVLVGCATSAAIFACCAKPGTAWQAIVDSYATYFRYLDRAEGVGHEKPWDYYLQLLAFQRDGKVGPWWSEGLILGSGAIGCILAFTPLAKRAGHPLAYRFLAIYTVLSIAIYSAIPYKTPWSLLAWHFTLALLGGLTLAVLFSIRRPYMIVPAMALAVWAVGLANLWKQTRQSLYPFQADTRNPYVYGHTTQNLLKAVRKVHDLAKLHADGAAMPIHIFQEDQGWPLPWYFRGLKQVGFWKQIPQTNWAQAPVIITSANYDAQVEPVLRSTHECEALYGMREGMNVCLYVEKSLWQRFLATR